MKYLFLFVSFFLVHNLFGQSNIYHFPSTDSDVKEVHSIKVEINDLKGNCIIRSFTEKPLTQSYFHKEFEIPYAAIDTLIITTSKDGNTRGLTMYLCNELVCKESFITGFGSLKKNDKTFRKKTFGGWTKNVDLSSVQQMVDVLNDRKPQGKTCHKSYSNIYANMIFSSGPSIGDELIYDEPDKMPSYNDSQSVDSRNKNIQEFFNQCLDESNYESSVLLGNFIVDENGQVQKPYVKPSQKRNVKLRESAKKCLENMNGWTAGENQGVKVKTKISFIVGVNVNDPVEYLRKYQLNLLDKESVEKVKVASQENNQAIEIPMNALSGDEDNDQVFQVVEYMPKASKSFDSDFTKFVKSFLSSSSSIQSKTVFKFVVERDGTTSNVRILSSDNYEVANKGKQFIERSTGWIPGKQRGKTQRVDYTYNLEIK